MLREFKVSREIRASVVTCYGLVAASPLLVHLFRHRSAHSSWISNCIGLAVVVIGLTVMAMMLKFSRVVATSEGIEAYDWLGRLKFALPYSDLTAYRQSSRSNWRVATEEKEYKLPNIEFDDFHRLMVSNATQALRAKRWKTGQVPSLAEVDEPLFDARSWIISVGTLGCFAGVLVHFCNSAAVIGGFGTRIWKEFYQLRDVSARLRMNSESISETRFRGGKSINWPEVQAVFQVQQGGSRCFVVTSEDESIFIPPHIARDLEAMRKFFYSIPQGTLCVNFDEKSTKGYRRRRRSTFGRKLEPAVGL